MTKRVFITVAEVSGDQHAAQLVRSLRSLDESIIVEGHGGPRMRAQGVILHQETTGRAAMSWRAIGRAAEMWKLLQWTKRRFEEQPPDLMVCIDSPAVNLHFARAARERGIPVLYYIPPQLWAWRIQERRMKKLRRWVNRVACILPFEEEYFRSNGVDATFVGHPLFDALPLDRGPEVAVKYPARPPVVGLLTGSRRSEAMGNFPHLIEVAQQIVRAIPNVSFLVPTTSSTQPVVAEMLATLKREGLNSSGPWKVVPTPAGAGGGPNVLPIQFAQDAFDRMVPQCDLCVTKSGTSTLHVAGYGVPMIVVYRGNPVLWHLIARWLIKARTYSLVNVLSGAAEHVVPEFIPWYGSNLPVAQCAIDLLQHPQKLACQREKLLQVVQKLDKPGASLNVARLAMSMMGQGAAEAVKTGSR